MRSVRTEHERSATRAEMMVGRLAAICAHPYAAWWTRSRRRRVALVLGYAAAGYGAVLATLLVW